MITVELAQSHSAGWTNGAVIANIVPVVAASECGSRTRVIALIDGEFLMMKKLLIVGLAVTLFALTACSMVAGAGEDIQGASKATKDAMTGD